MTTELPTTTVRVALGRRSYDVRIGHGLVARTAAEIERALGARRCIIVADATLATTPHLAQLCASLRVEPVLVPPGETSKSLASFANLVETLLGQRPDRQTVIVACGGGVIGDLAGFAAATLLRGLHCVQIPTTLLAQVDSAVGGKTGVNSTHGKNLVGAFHQPALVLADLDTLATLPARERRSGYAEIVKYGLLGDATFFAWLEAQGAAAIGGASDALAYAVATSVRAKAEIVTADEEEQSDRRALLNLGHTFAHAYETLTGYDDRLRHGEAVALGLVQAFRLSARLGLCDPADGDRVQRHLKTVGLPVAPSAVAAFPAADVVAAMRGDKKAADGRLAFVLVRGIGEAFVSRDVPEDLLLDHLRKSA